MRQESPILHTPELGLALAVVPPAERIANGEEERGAGTVEEESAVSDAVAVGTSAPVAIKKRPDKAYRGTEVLLRLASELLARLAEAEVEQKRVEHALGLSQGYLSHIKAGRNAPSAMLVSELVLLAKDPERRLKELEKFWKRQLAA